MANVTNMSNQAISIPVAMGEVITTYFFPPRMRVKKGSDSEEEVHPDSEQVIADDQIQSWLKRPINQAMVNERRILVEMQGDDKVQAAPAPTPGGAEHWATLVNRISTITDADELERLYVGEKRQKVKAALEARMSEIR